MNHIYRLVWNASKHMLMAVAEIAGSRSKGSSPRMRGSRKLARRSLALAIASVLAPSIALAAQAPVVQPSATALPAGGQVVAGHATLHQSGATLDINQSTQKAILNWQSFDIGQHATVNFVQPGSSSVALNRILGNAASQIYGHLNANGQVFLVNPNGVFFARGAEVNTAGIVASTLGISNQDFLSGNYRFNGTSSAGITNQGRITAAKGGYVAFIGRTVDNEGHISTPEGTIALGAGGAVDMRLAGGGLVSFHVSQGALKAQAKNGGIIAANGGAVLLTAQAKNALLETVVNNTGVIRAQTAVDHDGSIELLGGDSGTVKVAGTLDASAPDGGAGGTIETSGLHVKIANSAVITTQATNGHDGRWTIDPNDFTIAASGGDITGSALSTALASGNVTIQTTSGAASCVGATCGTGSSGNGDIEVNDSVSWSAHTLTLNAYRNIDINTAMNGSGSAGLALQYGQGASNGVIGGTAATYNVNAPVNLASGGSFTTQLGSSGSVVSYTIITTLGAAGSTTKTDLQGISGGLGGHYVLGADIDASPTSGWNGGQGFVPIGSYGHDFTGTFDGLGHTINELTIKRPMGPAGLFRSNKGTLRNVGLVGGSVSGSNKVGGLVGRNESNGKISDAYATGSVSGVNNVGGLVGSNAGTISNAYATGSVSGSNTVGGLVGSNAGTISNAYATGSVSGSSYVGGLVGYNFGGTISDVYVTGSVSGSSNVGGLVGYIPFGTGSHGYWDTTTDTNPAANNGFGTGLSTASLAAALPTGFDSSKWGNGGDKTTPYLLANTSFGTVSGSVILGSDTSATPTAYGVILNVAQLQAINSTGLANNYVLGTNIDASATSGWNGGKGFAPIGPSAGSKFTGTFDGLGHTVNNLTINSVGSNIGLFGINSGMIRDVGVVNGMIAGHDNVGGLVGNNSGTISDAYATGSVSGDNGVGGLVGSNNAGTISDAYATGSVSGFSTVGGLVGYSDSTISDAYATGSVSGGLWVGGLVGVNSSGTISDAYATGSVSGTNNVGGLVGSNHGGTVSDGYWDTTTSGQPTTGIGVGTATGATGLTTASLAAALPTGFDSSKWGNGGDKTTPYLLANASFDTVSGSVILGSDTSATPTAYGVILTLNQLQAINSTGLAKNYVLGTNIDATTTSGWNGGKGFAPIGNGTTKFTGTFDGLNHTINDLTISRPTSNDVGLFGYNTGALRNVGMVGGSVVGKSVVGGLVGSNHGTISDAYATGSVSGHYSSIGGLVGRNSNGTISDAYATGSVSGGSSVGGLAGFNTNGTISDAYATGSVSGNNNVGGLVGLKFGGTISDAYATGSVSGTNKIGGLVGFNLIGTISNAYATGSISGTSKVGGLVGSNNAGTVTDGYWDTTTSGQSAGIGAGTTTGATGLSTASLAAALPTGFDGSKWGNGGGQTTPYLLANASFDTVSGSVVLGSDTSSTPTAYGVILNVTQLQAINSTGLANDYVLGTNIDASATSGWNGGKGFAPIGNGTTKFTGTFDGLNHTINDLTISRPTSNDVGLFGYNTGTLRDVGLVGGSVGGKINVGGLVGSNSGTISAAYATGSVSGDKGVGGLVGASDGAISDAYATGSVSGDSVVGGLVGYNNHGGTVSDAYATGSVSGSYDVGGLVGSNFGTISDAYDTGSVSGSSSVGGLVGVNIGGTISDAYATGSVSVSGSNVGGLVGVNDGTISDVYATGSVSGSSDVGGLAGFNIGGTISDAYATGSVSGTGGGTAGNKIGGLVGVNKLGTISDVYATGSVSGSSNVGGLVGSNANGTISDVYATGHVSGSSKVGGLVGINIGTVSKGYWDTTTSGQPTTGIGAGTTTGATGLSTASLAAALPSGFDSSKWGNGGGQTTPYLLANASFDTVSGSVLLGSDTSATPTAYGVILTLDQLQAINSTGLAKNYVLGTNIDASATSGWNGGQGFAPIGNITTKFTGTFDGLGHTVNDLTIDRPTTNFVGLFGASTGTVRNVGVVDGSVSGKTNVGGLVGWNYNGTVSDAYATGSVSGNFNVGDLVGSNNGTVSDAYATGSVSGNGNSNSNVGGLVGRNYFGTISDAYATGSVSGNINVGGLVGSNYYLATISDAYATGSVSGNHSAGGLVGSSGGTVSHGYWDTTTSAQPTMGIGAGINAGATGLTTAQMMQASNFSGWSIDTDGSAGKTMPWRIYAGNTMPLLTAFLKPLDVTINDSSQVYNGAVQTSTGGYTASGGYDASLILGMPSVSSGGRNVGTYAVDGTGFYSSQRGYDLVVTDGTLTITPATLTLAGLAASNKTYDATNTATATGTLDGILGSDTVTDSLTASFDNKNVGTSKTVTVDGITLGGTDAGNYQIATGQTTTANISKATLTLTGLAASNKTYDATNTATATGSLSGILGSDTATDSLTASFDNKNVGTGKTVTVDGITLSGTDAGNYQIATGQTTTANISKATLTLAGLAASNKTYDATNTATATGTLDGILGSDTVTDTLAASFDNKNVDTGKTVTVDGITLSGTDAGNYQIADGQTTTANITKATLTLAGLAVADKAADGTTLGTISNDGSLAGVLSGDTVNLNGSSAVASFASAGVGNDLMVDVTGLTLTGTDAGNYVLASPQLTHASILPAPDNGGGTEPSGPSSGPSGQNSGTGVAGATAQSGYLGVASGPSSQLNPRWMFALVQGPGKSPRVDFQIVSGGSAGVNGSSGANGTANGPNQTCTNDGDFGPFSWSGGAGTCAKGKSNDGAGL